MEEIGLSIVEKVKLYRVAIEGRGGDSVHDEYFETSQAAVVASALDGQNRTPAIIQGYKLSDGTVAIGISRVQVSPSPTEEDEETLRQRLGKEMTPAMKLLIGGK